MLAKNPNVLVIILICIIRLLLNCHTLIVCQFLLMPASLQRLFLSGCRVFTLHGFVVICVEFGSQQYDVSQPSLSNCILIILSLALFCLIADYGPCLFPVDITSVVIVYSVSIMVYLIMSVHVEGSWRLFMSLMSVPPLCYDLFCAMFQIGDYF